jgi:hypothetical protein
VRGVLPAVHEAGSDRTRDRNGAEKPEGLRLSPQSFGQMMRNPIYIGKIESPDYGVSTS